MEIVENKMERCVFRDYFVEEFGSDLPPDWRPYLFESINNGKHIFIRGAVARIKKKGKRKGMLTWDREELQNTTDFNISIDIYKELTKKQISCEKDSTVVE